MIKQLSGVSLQMSENSLRGLDSVLLKAESYNL